MIRLISLVILIIASSCVFSQQILTPSGYVAISDISVGDTVISYDTLGILIKNTIVSKVFVDQNGYPSYDDEGTKTSDTLYGYLVNNIWNLCKYQSAYCNGYKVKHGYQIMLGDTLYDTNNQPIIVSSILKNKLNGWWKLSISGDHNFIMDGLKLHNASRFWVGGGGTWDASSTTHWSGASGGASGSSVPTSADDVTFDNASNASGYTCTISSVNGAAANFTLNGPASGTLTLAGNRGVSCTGNVVLKSSGNLSITNTGSLGFIIPSGTQTITSNGTTISMGLVTNSGTFQALDDITCSNTNSNGSFRTNGGTFDPNGFTVTFTGLQVSIVGSLTFYNFTRTGTANKLNILGITGSITVTNNFVCNGNSITNRMMVHRSGNDGVLSPAANATITAASVSVTNSDFCNITGAGAGSWNLSSITGGSGDCGGNSNITFTSAVTQTATGTSGFTWSTHGWTTRVPLPQDSVIVSNSFSASQTITADMPRLGKSVMFSCSGSPVLSITNPTNVYGNLDLTGVGAFTSTTNSLTFQGRGTYTFTSAGKNINCPITIMAPGGTLLLGDSLAIGTTTARTLGIGAGTLDLNGHNITHFGQFNASAASNSITRSLSLGSKTYDNTTTTAISIWSYTTGSFTVTGSGTIKVSGSTANIRTFDGGGGTYPTLWYTNATANGELDITGSNKFNTLKCTDSNSQTLKFTAGTTTTINSANGFQLLGAASHLIKLDCITASTFTLSIPGNIVVADYLSIKNCLAKGGARWFAGIHSTNISGNNGWRFTDSNNRQGIYGL